MTSPEVRSEGGIWTWFALECDAVTVLHLVEVKGGNEMVDSERPSGTDPSPSESLISKKGELFRLAKVVGVTTIVASAISQEYASGVNLIAPQSVGVYPRIEGLVAVAMFVTGIFLLPKIFMFARFSSTMPSAGSTYSWISRTVSGPVSFVVSFVWFVGLAAAIGVIAFAFTTFLSSAFALAGWPGSSFLLSTTGRIVVGLLAIWLAVLVHLRGVKHYSVWIRVFLVLVVIAAVVAVVYSLATSTSHFLALAHSQTGVKLSQPAHKGVTLSAFLSVCTLLVFAYGGVNAAPSLGGETREATSTMPRAIYIAWASIVVMYTIVVASLFQLVPWWAVAELTAAKQTTVTSLTGLISVVAPKAIGVLYSLLVAVIVVKALLPQILGCSRTMFAWGEDHMLPEIVCKTNKNNVPSFAIILTATLGSLFLIESVATGFTSGLIVRSFSVLLVMAVLGVGVLNVRFGQKSRFVDKPWITEAVRDPAAVTAAVVAIVVAVVLVHATLTAAGKGLLYQPWLQGLIILVVGVILSIFGRWDARRRGVDIRSALEKAPVE